MQGASHPPEVRSLGRTLTRWLEEITNSHKASVASGPTEAVNNPIKRIQPIGFGFRSFERYQSHALHRATRLGPPRHGLTPLKSEGPTTSGRMGTRDLRTVFPCVGCSGGGGVV
jgi:Transposase